MSKTRVYSVFCEGQRVGGIHLDYEGAEQEREFYAHPVVMEKDISEEEYARIAIDYMEQDAARKAWEKQRNPPPEPERHQVPADDWMSHEGWTPCNERPEPPPHGRTSQAKHRGSR